MSICVFLFLFYNYHVQIYPLFLGVMEGWRTTLTTYNKDYIFKSTSFEELKTREYKQVPNSALYDRHLALHEILCNPNFQWSQVEVKRRLSYPTYVTVTK